MRTANLPAAALTDGSPTPGAVSPHAVQQPAPIQGDSAGQPLPAWMRQPGEPWRDWERRRLAGIEIEAERKLAQPPQPLDPLYSGSLALAIGAGTFDCNGNAKGSGWW